jgi:hypothetical protein
VRKLRAPLREAEAELENDGADELPASAQYQAGQPTTVFQ